MPSISKLCSYYYTLLLYTAHITYTPLSPVFIFRYSSTFSTINQVLQSFSSDQHVIYRQQDKYINLFLILRSFQFSRISTGFCCHYRVSCQQVHKNNLKQYNKNWEILLYRIISWVTSVDWNRTS